MPLLNKQSANSQGGSLKKHLFAGNIIIGNFNIRQFRQSRLLSNALLSNALLSNALLSPASFGRMMISACLLLLLLPSATQSQWNNNTQKNTLIVTERKNPINIASATDHSGGAFVFWEDKNEQRTADVFFQHFDEEGNISFRADGKPVSSLQGIKSNAVCAPYDSKSAVVVWKDLTYDKSGDLFAQKVSTDGRLLFGQGALRITSRNGEELDPAVTSDSRGNIFITYINRDYSVPSNYSVHVQKITPQGNPGYRENGVQVERSLRVKSQPQIAPDNRGGVFVFWVESVEGTAQLYSSHIDSLGNENWSRSPLLVSSPKENVFNYTVIPAFNNSAYIAWEVKRADKDILHQLVSLNGQLQWRRGRDVVTSQFGAQTSPQTLFADSSVFVSWTNESLKDKDIYIQKFSSQGKAAWKKDGVEVIRMKGNQVSQRLISDRAHGAIIAWIDNRQTGTKGNIYAQRINRDGRPQWDSTGVEMASAVNTEKSYISLVPNKTNGAVLVFKESRSGMNNIYAQRILGTGRYVFEILNFTAGIQGEDIKLSWQTSNESNNKGFFVERALQDSGWQKIKFIAGKNRNGVNNYDFTDRPMANGTIMYRIQQLDNQNNSQRSSSVKLNYFGADYNDFAVSQNFPNPFSDSTFIRYYLPVRTNVVLEVYNDKIETITELVHGVQDKGEYNIKFSSYLNGQRLPSGVYFYKLKAGEFVDVKKMIISK